ncbi:MAG: hypothetical protein AB8G22_18245, partial [Saprospiraceae bacterium]
MLNNILRQSNTKWLFALVIISEILIYFLCLQELSQEVSPYQLMARYSARVSFVIFVVLYGWIAWVGLKRIFQATKSRDLLVAFLLAFAVNHIIHLGFLSYNYWLQPFPLSVVQHGGGAIAYLVLSILPLWLAQVQQLTTRRYYSLHLALFFIWIFFNQSYMGRYLHGLDWGSAAWVYGSFF